jgi:SAM-dependent methyltransferase
MRAMRSEIEQVLFELSLRFYDGFAEPFANSRGASEPGLDRLIARIQPRSRVLDLGCGQARLAQLLPPSCTYVGVDNSLEMLRVAADMMVPSSANNEDGARNRPDTTLVHSDLVADDWDVAVGSGFHWIVLRSVLQHIPGYRNRLGIIRRARSVCAAGGHIIVANWQFLRAERLRRRILPWSTLGLAEDDVDCGDFLLQWARGGRGLRYVHLIDEAETQRLAADAGLSVLECFDADGHTNDLTLYVILA